MSYLEKPSQVLDLVTEDQAHRDVYINQEVYELEIQHLFRNTWVYVGHASQIPKKGDFYTTTIGDQPLILVRHSDDSVKVLENRCAHRGVQLVAETQGNVKTFQCPYHAWTYRTDGSLLGIPKEEGYASTNFSKSCAQKGLVEIKNVKVYREFVFARLNGEGVEFEEFFGDSLSSLDNMVDRSPEGRLEIVGNPLRYINNCNWKMLVENQTDSFHPMIVHYSSAGVVKEIWDEIKDTHNGPRPMVVECVVPFTSDYEFYAKMGIRIWKNGHGHTGVNFSIHSDYEDAHGYFESMVKAYGEDRAKEILNENRHNTVYFPNIMVKGPIQTLRLFKPLAANKTLVESWIFRLVGAPDMLLERTAMYNRLINAPTSIVGHDDTEMYERATEGLLCNGNKWMNFQRDFSQSEGNKDVEEFPGSTEAQMRNQFRAWKTFMHTVKSGNGITT